MLRLMFVHRDMRVSGGVPNCILNFARSRDRDRVDVHVGSLQEPTTMDSLLAAVQAPVHHIGDRGYLLPGYRLRRYLRSEQIEVVVCCSFKSYIVGKLASVGTRCRAVFWIHAIPLVIKGPVQRALTATLARFDTMVFVSEACKTAHLPASHRGSNAVVYNGVPDWKQDPEHHEPYQRGDRARFDIPPDAFVMCYVAEMIGWKDHLTLLNAFAEVSARRTDAHLLLVGDGELRESLRLAAASAPHPGNIHFLGTRSDARRIMGLADVYVHPSRGEGFGLAVVEAMLAERPVVVAREGAMPEYVVDGSNGLSFEPGDAKELAEKILSLADHPDTAQRMGEEARRTALDRFSTKGYVEALTTALLMK